MFFSETLSFTEQLTNEGHGASREEETREWRLGKQSRRGRDLPQRSTRSSYAPEHATPPRWKTPFFHTSSSLVDRTWN